MNQSTKNKISSSPCMSLCCLPIHTVHGYSLQDEQVRFNNQLLQNHRRAGQTVTIRAAQNASMTLKNRSDAACGKGDIPIGGHRLYFGYSSLFLASNSLLLPSNVFNGFFAVCCRYLYPVCWSLIVRLKATYEGNSIVQSTDLSFCACSGTV